MSVRIENISPPYLGNDLPHTYQLRFGQEQPLLTFTHTRGHGLAACLRAAADAVERADLDTTRDAERHGVVGPNPTNTAIDARIAAILDDAAIDTTPRKAI